MIIFYQPMKPFITVFTLISIFYIPQITFAQNAYLQEVNSDVAIGFDSKNFVTNLTINRIHKLPVYKDLIKVGLGYGLRYTGNFAQDATLDASVRDLPVDASLMLSDIQTHALNLNINFQISVWKFDLGGNIDALGFSFGARQKGTITTNSSDISGVAVKPTAFNILQGFPQDEGNLQSERLYIRYWINKKMAVRLAMAHTFAEYKLEDTDSSFSERYRHVTSPMMFGFTYKFWKKAE